MKRPVVAALVLAATALALPGLGVAGCKNADGAHITVDLPVSTTLVTDANPGPAWKPDPVWSITTGTTASTDTTASTETTVPTSTSPPADEPAEATLRITRYEEDWTSLSWVGIWTLTGGARDSGGTSRYTEVAGSAVTVEFTGVSLVFITRTARDLGRVKITVDDGVPVMVDCYSPLRGYKQVLWATDPLEPGPHVVKIECAGTANRDSIGTGVYIDAFVIAESPEVTPEEAQDDAAEETLEETS
jgi:hypothetical protein